MALLMRFSCASIGHRRATPRSVSREHEPDRESTSDSAHTLYADFARMVPEWDSQMNWQTALYLQPNRH